MAIVRNAREIYDLDCVLCEENFKTPKVLPCLHTFCLPCLEQIIRVPERSLSCPICNVEMNIPANGLSAIADNTFATNMLNILAVQNPTTCTNCEDREWANSRCLDCVENLCSGCVLAHERIRQTKTHKVIPFDELQNNAVHEAIKCPSFCKIHGEEILKYYCSTCGDAICRDCALYEHREHNYTDLKEAVKVHQSILNELLEKAKHKIPVVTGAIKEVSDVAKSLKQRKAIVGNIIKETIDSHIKTLEDKRVTIMDELTKIYSAKELVLEEQHMALEMDLSNLINSCEFVDHMITYGNEAEIMTLKKMMVGRLEAMNKHKSELDPRENDTIDFLPHDDPLKVAIQEFGSLSTSETFPPLCYLYGAGATNAKLGLTCEFLVVTKNRFNKAIVKGGEKVEVIIKNGDGVPIHVDVRDLRDGTYKVIYKVITKEKHSVVVFVRDKLIQDGAYELNVTAGIDCLKIGPLLTKFGSGGIINHKEDDENYEPWGIVCDHRGNILVTDHNNHKIQKFDANGKLAFQFGIRGRNDGEIWYPTGIAVDRQNLIYVADHGNHRMQVYDSEGEYIRTFGERGTADGHLKGPCGIAVDLDDRLIVTDRDNHRVQVFRLDGTFCFSFGGYGSGDGKFNSPRHVAIDSDNNILISDTNNHRVQCFDKQGKFLSKFGHKGSDDGEFLCPSGVATDSENKIVIADFKECHVQIFSTQGVFLRKIGCELGKPNGMFSKPTGICVSRSGNVLVADRGTNKIHML